MKYIQQILSIAFLLVISTRGSPSLPVWPDQAVATWIMYNGPPTPLPPTYNQGLPPPPYSAGRGFTYYDWSIKAMREVYLDFCVPIFPNGNNWKCDFLNVKEVSYLVMYEDRPKDQPECCIFEQPWYPPAPNFLEVSNATFNGTGTVWNRPVEWFLIDVSVDEGGPFGYSYYTDTMTPSSFYFGGVGSMVLQQYQQFNATKPDRSVWTIPKSCYQATNCTF